MKAWVENHFDRYYLRDLNLNDLGVYVRTRYSNIVDEYKDCICIDNEDEDAKVVLPYLDIDEALEDTFDYEYCDWFDDYDYHDVINNLTKNFPHYLVCAYNSNWLGQTGYKFSSSMSSALSRDYDTHMYVSGGSPGGKSILIHEYSHDVPMGADTVVIGLTQKEFDKLSNLCYNSIIDFADKKSDSIVSFYED